MSKGPTKTKFQSTLTLVSWTVGPDVGNYEIDQSFLDESWVEHSNRESGNNVHAEVSRQSTVQLTKLGTVRYVFFLSLFTFDL